MEQQQKKRDGPVCCVCEEWPAAEHRKSTEPKVVHGSVPARWDSWSGCGPHLESQKSHFIGELLPHQKQRAGISATPPLPAVVDDWRGCSGWAVVCQKSSLTHLVLLYCIKCLCIFGPKGTIQICCCCCCCFFCYMIFVIFLHCCAGIWLKC